MSKETKVTSKQCSIQEKDVHKILLKIGIPPNLKGYRYIIVATGLIMGSTEYMQHVTKGLYIDIASRCDTTPGCVESAIRHAITVACLRGNSEFLCKITGNSSPTNTQFLAAVYFYLTR